MKQTLLEGPLQKVLIPKPRRFLFNLKEKSLLFPLVGKLIKRKIV